METWKTFLFALGGNATLLAVLSYLCKSLLEKLITRDTRRFETELQAKSAATIEQLKNDLQLKTIEHPYFSGCQSAPFAPSTDCSWQTAPATD
jgi:hypothetical protein